MVRDVDDGLAAESVFLGEGGENDGGLEKEGMRSGKRAKAEGGKVGKRVGGGKKKREREERSQQGRQGRKEQMFDAHHCSAPTPDGRDEVPDVAGRSEAVEQSRETVEAGGIAGELDSEILREEE